MTRRTAKEAATVRNEVITMFENGAKASVIASELNLSDAYVYRILTDAGYKTAKRTYDVDAILADYNSDMRVIEVCSKHKISTLKLYQILLDAGIKTGQRRKQNDAVQKAVERYKNEPDTPVWKILQDEGVSQPQLHKELHEQDVPLRRK